VGVRGNTWIEGIFRPLAFAAMMGSIALALAGLLDRILPGISLPYLAACAFVASLEAVYSYRILRRSRLFMEELVRFRVVEWLLLFLVVKVLEYVGDPWTQVVAEIRAWPQEPLNFISLDTFVALPFAFFSWLESTRTAEDLERVGEPVERDPSYVSPVESLSGRFLWGGMLLIVATGLSQVEFRALLEPGRPSLPGVILNVLFYFLLGLVMLGQIRFELLRRRWEGDGVPVGEEVTGRWLRYGMLFIGLALLVAILLPTRYTVGLLEVVGGLLYVVSRVLWFLVVLLMLPLIWLLYQLSPRQETLSPPDLPELFPSPPFEAGGDAPAGWLAWVRSFLFWGMALALLFYVVRSYLWDHPELLEAWRERRLIGGLIRFLTTLWERLRGWAGRVRRRIPERLRRGGRERVEGERKPFRPFRFRSLSPRQRVLYYYLNLLEQAAREGFPRRPAQTPYEYGEAMRSRIPEAEHDVASLTESFVEARYSRREVEPQQARHAQGLWERLMEMLRGITGVE
jgi:hypothetical protein